MLRVRCLAIIVDSGIDDFATVPLGMGMTANGKTSHQGERVRVARQSAGPWVEGTVTMLSPNASAFLLLETTKDDGGMKQLAEITAKKIRVPKDWQPNWLRAQDDTRVQIHQPLPSAVDEMRENPQPSTPAVDEMRENPPAPDPRREMEVW